MPITINGDGTVTGISTGGLPDGSISTADIADDAVTLAKLSTTGTPGAGNFLRGDNSWQEAGGAWSVKSSGTFSGVSGVAVTGLSKTTRIIVTSQNRAGSASGWSFITSSNNGSSYDAGGSDYSFVQTQIHTDLSDGSSTVYNRIRNSTSSGSYLSSFGLGGGANTACFDIMIYDPANTSEYTAMSWEHIGRYSDGSNKGINSIKGATFRNSISKVDAFQMTTAYGGTLSGSYVALELN